MWLLFIVFAETAGSKGIRQGGDKNSTTYTSGHSLASLLRDCCLVYVASAEKVRVVFFEEQVLLPSKEEHIGELVSL